ncbi:MAG: hypothetical protein HYR96_05085 [Deltaproteobacteria bacterium]|nr:hypothetical protein [Deltaproteobacteria bacterium]
MRVRRAGGPVELRGYGIRYPDALAVDSDNVYVGGRGDQTVYAFAHNNQQEPSVLYRGEIATGISDMVHFGESLFWVDDSSSGFVARLPVGAQTSVNSLPQTAAPTSPSLSSSFPKLVYNRDEKREVRVQSDVFLPYQVVSKSQLRSY